MTQEARYRQLIADECETESLRLIADELHSLGEAWAGRLRMSALAKAVKVRNTHAEGILSPATTTPNVRVSRRKAAPIEYAGSHSVGWLDRFGLPRPDGRALFRYTLTDEDRTAIETWLCERAPFLRSPPAVEDAALFVLWAADWFRRCYHGQVMNWEDVGRPLGWRREQYAWRGLADAGLAFWRRPPLRINGSHERLIALAHEGGFPVAALEGGGSGWASRYLSQLVGRLLSEGEAGLDRAEQLALELEGTVPTSWRNQGMRNLCAELAFCVVALRREAEVGGAGAGALASAWLDRNRPDWRDDLPLVIASSEAAALIDGLLRVLPLKGGSGSISARRLLRHHGEILTESVELQLAGLLRTSDGKALQGLDDNWNRLRVQPAGDFARFAHGDLATAFPDDDGWTVRPASGRNVFEVPHKRAISLELHGGGRRVAGPFIVPGGEALSGELRICVDASEGREELFAVVGTASGGYRADQLFVVAPKAWSLQSNEEAAQIEVVSEGERRLWRVSGNVLVTADNGDVYLLRSGQQGDQRDHLSLIMDSPAGCSHFDRSVGLSSGAPRLELREGARTPRAAFAGEAWWRPIGERTWRAHPDHRAIGSVEYAWRDARSGHIRAKASATVLPVEFAVRRAQHDGQLHFSVVGWHGTAGLDCGTRTGPHSWRTAATPGGKNFANLSLQGDGSTINLCAPLPIRAWICDWAGTPVPRNEVLSLSTLDQFVARVEGGVLLMADLLDRDGALVDQARAEWWIDGERPLSTIRDDVASLLRPSADLDAKIKLNFNDGHENFWYVSEFAHELVLDGDGLRPTIGVTSSVELAARALAAPQNERNDFAPYDPTAGGHRPITLPHLKGDWLIYLREDERVLSRPYFFRGSPMSVLPNTALGKAMVHMALQERQDALNSLCEQIDNDPSSLSSRATLREIIDLVLSLRGLPPATFDILRLVGKRPSLGPLLLFACGTLEVEPILRLYQGLPFSWLQWNQSAWEAAAEAQAEFWFEQLPDQFSFIAGEISQRRRAISELEPALALQLDQSCSVRPLFEAANSFLNRADDRVRPESNPFRPEHEGHLPAWRFSETFWRALDAPVAAALASLGKLTLSTPQITAIKSVQRDHPRWFRDGYCAMLKDGCS